MTQLAALKQLAEKVEAGTMDWAFCGVQHVHGVPMNGSMWEAYNGDLNAAKALHEAVLGDRFEYSIYSPSGGFGKHEVQLENDHIRTAYGQPISGTSGCPARAWLLAIIRARITELEAKT